MNVIKTKFQSLTRGHRNSLVAFVVCSVLVILLLTIQLVVQNSKEDMELSLKERTQEESKESKIESEDKTSHYYQAKIEQSIEDTIRSTKEPEYVLELADATEGRQFVTSGKLVSRTAKELSAEEYEIFTRIVEAEVGAESYELKLLVANIILNRVDHYHFPNTVKEVVFQNNGRNYQFSPISNGSYYRVSVKESTIKAVDEALSGKDNSGGALYFMTRSISTASNVTWFDKNLTRVGQIGKVEYFR